MCMAMALFLKKNILLQKTLNIGNFDQKQFFPQQICQYKVEVEYNLNSTKRT